MSLPPSPTEISEMSRLIAMMNGTQPSVAPEQVRGSRTVEANTTLDDGVAAMKTILEQFKRGSGEMIDDTAVPRGVNGVRSVMDTLYEEASYDRGLREAMITQETDDGVIIGQWEIAVTKSSGRNLYNVFKLGEPPIATELTLYEAAHGLVTALNDGQPITSTFVRNLLHIEQEYANAVHDALHSKYTLRKQQITESKRVLLETKYSTAVHKAKDAQNRLTKLIESYPYQE